MVASHAFPALDARHRFFQGLRRRVVATVGLLAGGLSWVILYLAFLAGRFSWYQNLAVVLTSFLVVPAVIIAMWVSWGLAMGGHVHHAFWDDDLP